MLLAAAVAGVLSQAAPAAADYPERPITMVVPFAAGGGTDLSARTIAQFLEKEIGGKIVVVNKPGAAGEIGLAEVANAKPDGYTIGIINTPGIVTIPIEREARFKLDSFDMIAGVVDDPGTISVLESSPIKSIEDLVKAAKAKPGEITVGTQGVGSAGHIGVLLLEKAAGIDLKPIPFTGASTSRNALIAGEIQASMANLGEALTFAAGQPWRILGVMSPEPSPMAPDLPTFKSAGYDIEGGSLRGIGAPKGTPTEILEKLSAGIAEIVKNDEFKAIAKNTYQPLRYVPRAEYNETLNRADTTFRELWKTSPWNK
jgi:tripartite-type tricarboxylate transporter receptor subunit TctC